MMIPLCRTRMQQQTTHWMLFLRIIILIICATTTTTAAFIVRGPSAAAPVRPRPSVVVATTRTSSRQQLHVMGVPVIDTEAIRVLSEAAAGSSRGEGIDTAAGAIMGSVGSTALKIVGILVGLWVLLLTAVLLAAIASYDYVAHRFAEEIEQEYPEKWEKLKAEVAQVLKNEEYNDTGFRRGILAESFFEDQEFTQEWLLKTMKNWLEDELDEEEKENSGDENKN